MIDQRASFADQPVSVHGILASGCSVRHHAVTSPENEMRRTTRIAGLLVAVSLLALVLASVTGQAPMAVPVEPVSGIIDAFRTHRIVALAEGAHNNEPAHAFRLSLIRDTRFVSLVSDIVVEFGDARYQSTIDRFVNGESVADVQLRRVWEDTTPTIGCECFWAIPQWIGTAFTARTI
jgi:hypothetical protein